MDDNKVGRILQAIEFLKDAGKVHRQQDVAEMMGTDKANISRALKGDEKYLTNRFLRRFNEAYGNIFNIEWLIDGVGEMLVVNNGNIGNLVIGDGNTNTNSGGGNTANNRNTTTTTNNYSGCGCGGGDAENTLITSSMYQALFDELSAQRKVTEKAQAQIDTLLDIIKGISDK